MDALKIIVNSMYDHRLQFSHARFSLGQSLIVVFVPLSQ